METVNDPAVIAADLLRQLEYINLATVGAQGPWNTPVTGLADAALNLYWSSWHRAQHSLNLLQEPRVFITRYDSTRKRGSNHQRCLYMQARAHEITTPDEALQALQLLYPDESPVADDFFAPAERRLYMAIPERLWLNNLSEREVTADTMQMRLEVDLASVQRAYHQAP